MLDRLCFGSSMAPPCAPNPPMLSHRANTIIIACWLTFVGHTFAEPAGFSPSAPMGTPRTGHSATLLQDGRVLVAGGATQSTTLASAELFDPLLNQWSYTGSMAVPRGNHTATLLADGKVLVASGQNDVDNTTTCEIYDPQTGTWSFAASLPTYRLNAVSVLLYDGTVMVIGGFYPVSNVTPRTDIYSPVTNSWTVAGDMKRARLFSSVNVVPSGKVLMAGGFAPNETDRIQDSAELFDPATGQWTFTGSMTAPRTVLAGAPLFDGRILVMGGHNDSVPQLEGLASAEIYDPDSETWSAVDPMISPIYSPAAVGLSDGTVLVLGDLQSTSAPPTAQIFDPNFGAWYITGSQASRHSSGSITSLADGRVLLAGGYADSTQLDLTTEIYDRAIPPFSIVVRMQSASATLVEGQASLFLGQSAYAIESTDDLTVDFANVSGFAFTDVNGRFRFLDTRPRPGQRFYRAIVSPAGRGLRSTR